MDQRFNVLTLGVEDLQVKDFGYAGVLADPDGHTWEIAWIEALVRNHDGAVALPA